MRFHFTAISSNRKVGPIPVVTATNDTCPSSCALRGNGCYAESGHLGMFWKRLNTGKLPGIDFSELLARIKALPRRQLWRYAQAGDLPDEPEQVIQLAEASRNRPAIAYTHKRDIDTYKQAAKLGFHINLSADSLEEADELSKTGLPVVVVIPSDKGRTKTETVSEYRTRLGGKLMFDTPDGNKVVICPATYAESVTCSTCRVCSKPRPANAIVGFPAHGVAKRRIDNRLNTGA